MLLTQLSVRSCFVCFYNFQFYFSLLTHYSLEFIELCECVCYLASSCAVLYKSVKVFKIVSVLMWGKTCWL